MERSLSWVKRAHLHLFFFLDKGSLVLVWDERLIWAVGGVVPWLRTSETGGLAI